jgi:signal transduction histidine kinase
VGNLISNSIKFTPEKGEVHVDLQTRKEEKDQVELFIKVADNGVGMDEKTKDEILIGGKKSTEGTKGETGFGYGLSLVKHLIDKADGTFRISSKSGEGSTFRIVLPMK